MNIQITPQKAVAIRRKHAYPLPDWDKGCNWLLKTGARLVNSAPGIWHLYGYAHDGSDVKGLI